MASLDARQVLLIVGPPLAILYNLIQGAGRHIGRRMSPVLKAANAPLAREVSPVFFYFLRSLIPDFLG